MSGKEIGTGSAAKAALLLCLMLISNGCSTKQRVDNDADVSVAVPQFAGERAPRVSVDAAHGNYHTASNRYAPLASLLRNDGMRVADHLAGFSDASLAETDILIIANADSASGGSAFTAEEIAAVVRFVERGGGLLLVADHIPYPAAASQLAAAFGVRLNNDFAEDEGSGLFTRSNGGLTGDPLLVGISQIRTFSGSSFTSSAEGLRPLLRLGPNWTRQAMQGNGLSAKSSADGSLQAAVMPFGNGRVAIFAEAGMLTAQIEEGWLGRPMGFHAEGAEQNKLLVLRVTRWLARPATRSHQRQATGGPA